MSVSQSPLDLRPELDKIFGRRNSIVQQKRRPKGPVEMIGLAGFVIPLSYIWIAARIKTVEGLPHDTEIPCWPKPVSQSYFALDQTDLAKI